MRAVFFLAALFFWTSSYCQSPVSENPAIFPLDRLDGFLKNANKSIFTARNRIGRVQEKYLKKFERIRVKAAATMQRIDSSGFGRGFLANGLSNVSESSNGRVAHLASDNSVYVPNLDSVRMILLFLKSSKVKSYLTLTQLGKIKELLTNVDKVSVDLKAGEKIAELVRAEQNQIAHYIQNSISPFTSLRKSYSKYSKELYYYKATVDQAKEMLNEPDKAMGRLMSELGRFDGFKSFLEKNSILAELFPRSENTGSLLALDGLQTRQDIEKIIKPKILVEGGSNALVSNISRAQAEIRKVTDKIRSLGAAGADFPDIDFRPNYQRSQPFAKRLRYGFDVQRNSADLYLAAASSLLVNIGYQINDRLQLGIGANYRIGTGRIFNHIQFQNQGYGGQAYFNYDLPKKLFVTGHFEVTRIVNSAMPQNIGSNVPNYRALGAVGAGKTVNLNSGILKKAKLEVLWDFLSKRQIPVQAPFKFRVGYIFGK